MKIWLNHFFIIEVSPYLFVLPVSKKSLTIFYRSEREIPSSVPPTPSIRENSNYYQAHASNDSSDRFVALKYF